MQIYQQDAVYHNEHSHATQEACGHDARLHIRPMGENQLGRTDVYARANVHPLRPLHRAKGMLLMACILGPGNRGGGHTR
jgi:hypothetical protein